VRLVGPPSAELTVVNKSLTSGVSKGVVAPLFLEEIYPAVWMLAEAHGIDPLGAIAQSAIETGWGKYTGVVKPPFHNTAGLKVSPEQQALFPGTTDGDHPLAHAMFPTWEVGALAHVQHLCAYTGLEARGPVVDPRFDTVLTLNKRIETWEGLSGNWAPSATYGQNIVTMAQRIKAGL
jgi:hypothetical protein